MDSHSFSILYMEACRRLDYTQPRHALKLSLACLFLTFSQRRRSTYHKMTCLCPMFLSCLLAFHVFWQPAPFLFPLRLVCSPGAQLPTKNTQILSPSQVTLHCSPCSLYEAAKFPTCLPSHRARSWWSTGQLTFQLASSPNSPNIWISEVSTWWVFW